MENKTMTKIKFIVSFREEKRWLEEMAEKGWFFKNITWAGIRYTFEKGEPRKMVYEIDRFDLQSSPTLSEIQQKKEFLSLAEELGWREVTHDVDMNYYFEKEYEENGINELYNDDEMRKIHANKFYDHLMAQSKQLDLLALFISVWFGILALIEKDITTLIFPFAYVLFVIAYHTLMGHLASLIRRDLSLSFEEWMENRQKEEKCRVVFRIFFSSRRLEKYLARESAKGWHIHKITPFRYYFEKGEPQSFHYCIDSRASVNARLKKKHEDTFQDGKDIMLQNNDWQYQSVDDAAEKGWHYLCASSSLLILYTRTSEPSQTEVLPTRRLCLHPWLTLYGIIFVVGFITGFLISFLGIF